MAEVIRMPRMSDTMTEGVLVEWHKKIGDSVEAGDLLAEVETDKATMELESYQEGVLLHIGVEPGNAVPIDTIIAILGDKGEDLSAILEAEKNKASELPAEVSVEVSAEVEVKKEAPAKVEVMAAPVNQAPPPPVTAPIHTNGRIKASPLAKKMAEASNIDLSAVQGSGDDGRIVKRDIEAFVSNQTKHGAVQTSAQTLSQVAAPPKQEKTIVLPSFVGEEQFEDVPNSQMRKVIARRLGESKFSAPHFYLKMEINMDTIMQVRGELNELSEVRISFNDLIIKAAAIALRSNPAVNASWLGDVIRYNKHINIGMAVAVEEGLMVPVIRYADNKSLSHIATETRQLAGKARDRKLQPNEMSGNTFTISNLGMMDIDDFTAIINPPDACIMAVGRIAQVARFTKKGKVKPVNVMKVTLSCDHRVVDGAVGARFLQTFKALLENPMRMLV